MYTDDEFVPILCYEGYKDEGRGICLDVAPFTGIRQTGHAEDEGTQQGGDAEHQNDAAEDEEMVSERQEQNGTGGDEGVEENVDDGFHLHLSDVGNIKVIFLEEKGNEG